MNVVVVGAGLAGLSAAFELRRAGQTVMVLDAERRSGGVIVTEHPAPGWIVEAGPDGFLSADPDIPSLATEVGIHGRLVSQQAKQSLVWDGTSLAPLATGAAAELLEIDARGLDLSQGFTSFVGGMAELVAALADGATRHTAGVTSVHPTDRGFRLSATGGMSLECRALVLAIPSYAAAVAIAALDAPARHTLEAITYHPSVNVSLAYRREQIAHPLDASGFATAPGVGGVVRACTFASSKFPGRAPEGHALLRAFIGPVAGDPGSAAHKALTPLLGITGAPLWTKVFQWPRGIPRYGPAHVEGVRTARRRLAALGPIALAGAGYDGAGVSACVRSGRAAARDLLSRL